MAQWEAHVNNKTHLVVATWVAEEELEHLREIFHSNNMMGSSPITVDLVNLIKITLTMLVVHSELV